MEKAIVCFSGGHSSAIAAIETVQKYGKNNVILLNHDISGHVEHKDIKRFKRDVADYLDLDITPANMPGWETKGPLDVCREIKAFKVGDGTALCTNRLKTEPFRRWLNENYPSMPFEPRDDIKIIYGFDANETSRIQRRVGVLAAMGYLTDYPLACWERSIESTEDIGIDRPVTYRIYRHANCEGCLKAGWQQWYCTYCLRPDIWEEAKQAENEIGYGIVDERFLEEREEEFRIMRDVKGICPSEKMPHQTFWAKVRKAMPKERDTMPCDCAI